MLSSVLNSEKAARVNIQIMRAFVKLRQIAIDYNNFPQRLSEIEKLLMLYMEKTDGKLEEHDQNFSQIIEVLNNLIETPREPKKIGFRVPEDKH
jgi:type IV secretory pathway VirB4 component